MRTLALHIGAHKTGTSSIQHYLKHSKCELKAAGWRFVYLPGPINLAQLLNWDPTPEPNFRLRPRTLKRITHELQSCTESCIMSSEDLFFLDDLAQIERLRDTLAPEFDRIRLVIYLRRQDQMAVSLKAQGAKTIQASLVFGSSPDPLPEVSPAVLAYLDYERKIELWAKAFGWDSLQIRIFEPDKLEQGDAVVDFFKQTGLPLRQQPVRRNESLGNDATTFLQTLRFEGITPSTIWPMYRAGFIERRGGSLRKPAKKQAQAFQDRFTAGNARLAAKLELEQLFSDRTNSYQETESAQVMDQGYARRNCTMMLWRLGKFCGPAQLETVTLASGLVNDSSLEAQLLGLAKAMEAYLAQGTGPEHSQPRPDVVETDELWKNMQQLITLSRVANDKNSQILLTTASTLRQSHPRLAYQIARIAWVVRPFGRELGDVLSGLQADLRNLKKWTLRDEATRLWLRFEYYAAIGLASQRAKF